MAITRRKENKQNVEQTAERRKKELDAAPCALAVAQAAVDKAQDRIDTIKVEVAEANRVVSDVDPYAINSRFIMMKAEGARDAVKVRLSKVRGEYATAVGELQRIEKSATATRGWYWSHRNGVSYLESRARRGQLEGLIADLVPLADAHPDLRLTIQEYRDQLSGIAAQHDDVLQRHAESYERLTGERIEDTDPVPEDDELTMDFSQIHGRPRKRRLDSSEGVVVDEQRTTEDTHDDTHVPIGRPRVGSAAHLTHI
jgi:hypothetical protein